MRTFVVLLISMAALVSCFQPENTAVNSVVIKNIKKKDYYSNGKVKSVSEMTTDSVLDGLTIWYDSLGRKVGEQIFLKGKLRGITKTYYENGQLAKETEYLDDNIIKEKEYNIDGTFLYQYPIDAKDIGPIKVIIGHNSLKYFRKNIADTVKIFAENLPLTNMGIKARNAKKRGIGMFKYVFSPNKNSSTVTIILALKKQKDYGVFIPIDSVVIEVK